MKRIINGPYLLEHHEPGCYEESLTYCVGCVWVSVSSHQLRWGERETGLSHTQNAVR